MQLIRATRAPLAPPLPSRTTRQLTGRFRDAFTQLTPLQVLPGPATPTGSLRLLFGPVHGPPTLCQIMPACCPPAVYHYRHGCSNARLTLWRDALYRAVDHGFACGSDCYLGLRLYTVFWIHSRCWTNMPLPGGLRFSSLQPTVTLA